MCMMKKKMVAGEQSMFVLYVVHLTLLGHFTASVVRVDRIIVRSCAGDVIVGG